MKLFDEIPYIENEYVILKRIDENDAQAIEEMASDPWVRKFLPMHLYEYGFEDKKDAIRNMYGDIFTSKLDLFLGIYQKGESDNLAGIIELYNYDPNWNKVSIGVRLRRSCQGKGIAKQAIALSMEYLLEKTDVKRITAHIDVENKASAKVFEDLGFRIRIGNILEDWGGEEPLRVNKYVYEKWGNIKYVKIGNGEKTMVILPGLALKSTLGAASAIEKTYSMFSNYTIYLFDDRSNIGDNYTIRERAGDVAAEMKTLGLRDAYVFGTSMGGMVGQYLAIDHPDLVKKLYLASTLSRPNENAIKVLSGWRELAIAHDMKNLIDRSLEEIYAPAVVEQYGDMFRGGIGEVSDEELSKFVILINAILHVNTYDELDKIKCPVYVVWALGDKVVTDLGGKEISRKLGCKYYEYGNEYAHAVYDEAPDHKDRLLAFFEEA